MQRVVPGADAGHHAQRLAPRVAEGLRSKIDVLAAETLCKSGKILEAIRPGGHIHYSRFLDGFAGIAGFELGEFLVARPQDVGGAAQDSGPLARRSSLPTQVARSRGADRRVDLC